MMEAWVTLTPLQRALYTLVSRDSNKRKMRAAMRVLKQHSRDEMEQAASVLVTLGFIHDRSLTDWL